MDKTKRTTVKADSNEGNQHQQETPTTINLSQLGWDVVDESGQNQNQAANYSELYG